MALAGTHVFAAKFVMKENIILNSETKQCICNKGNIFLQKKKTFTGVIDLRIGNVEIKLLETKFAIFGFFFSRAISSALPKDVPWHFASLVSISRFVTC